MIQRGNLWVWADAHQVEVFDAVTNIAVTFVWNSLEPPKPEQLQRSVITCASQATIPIGLEERMRHVAAEQIQTVRELQWTPWEQELRLQQYPH